MVADQLTDDTLAEPRTLGELCALEAHDPERARRLLAAAVGPAMLAYLEAEGARLAAQLESELSALGLVYFQKLPGERVELVSELTDQGRSDLAAFLDARRAHTPGMVFLRPGDDEPDALEDGLPVEPTAVILDPAGRVTIAGYTVSKSYGRSIAQIDDGNPALDTDEQRKGDTGPEGNVIRRRLARDRREQAERLERDGGHFMANALRTAAAGAGLTVDDLGSAFTGRKGNPSPENRALRRRVWAVLAPMYDAGHDHAAMADALSCSTDRLGYFVRHRPN